MRTLVLFALAASSFAGIITNGSYTLTASDPTMPTRLDRDGVTSEWGVARSFPGTIDTGAFSFQEFVFNSGSTPFIQVTFGDTLNLTDNIQVALYTTALDPVNDLSIGWLGDAGLSTGDPQSVTSFRTQVATNTDYVLLFLDVNSNTLGGTGVCVEGFSTSDPVPTCTNYDGQLTLFAGSVPEPSSLALLGGLLPVLAYGRRKLRCN